jgi:antirestriction protein ArdC
MSETVYQVITDRVIALLKQGTIPWQKPWQGAEQAPQNLVSRKAYRGVNVFLLHAMHYTSPYWLTFKQAQELGGHVRKGEKACPVVFWKWLDVERDGEKERVPFLRYYSVFNAGQCEGLEGHVPAVPGVNAHAHKPIEEAERIVAGMPKRPEIRQGLDRAFYSPGGDYVGMPSLEQFKSAEDWHSVLYRAGSDLSKALQRRWLGGVDGRLEGLTVNFDPVILASKQPWPAWANAGASLTVKKRGAKRPLSPHGNHVEEANHPCRNGLLRSDPELPPGPRW